MIVHRLDGCAPTPLAHYLKALGILRLVAEQADSEARGWWEGERFLLSSTLHHDDLLTFFLDLYQPTPMFNPWGARSGFYQGSSENSARTVLAEIERSSLERFVSYRNAIATVRSVLGEFGGSKPADIDGQGKRNLTLALRRAVRGPGTLWLDAVIATIDTSKRGIEQPALFGTGGSEGSGSYTSAYMAALHECLLRRQWDHVLETCLFGRSTGLGQNWDKSFGQFLPAGIGTPWDLILAFEGACVIRSSVATRSGTQGDRWLASPFFVAPLASGFPSAGRSDEFVLNKGKELPGRGEQWFPLWGNPVRMSELSQLFAEGRALTRRGRANDCWSMARAITSLGVSHGVREFVRFGYLQRNNQATHFAVPTGRFVVADRVLPRLTCLDDIDAWLPRLRREARSKGAPARLRMAERRLTDALFAVIQHPEEAARWQAVLLRLADVEAVQVAGSGYKVGPIPALRPEWVAAADDGSAELRLALSCALQTTGYSRVERTDGVRRHWLPLDGSRYAVSRTGEQARLQVGPECVVRGRSGLDDAIALVGRRLIEAAQHGERRLPLIAARSAAASSADLAAFLAGEVDADATLHLARALMAIDSRAWRVSPFPTRLGSRGERPDDGWLVIRLSMLPWALPDGRHIGADPAILRRLSAGDASTAFELARRRLHAAGIATAVRAATVAPAVARRWAAALAFPITVNMATQFVERLDPQTSNKETA